MAVYLLHFHTPISFFHTCQHYLGYADFWPDRIAIQRAGNCHAARLCQVARERGIDFTVVRIWPDGDRALERQLKNRKNSPRLCPVCRGETAVLPDVNFYLDQQFVQKNGSAQTHCPR